jgi:Bacterial Ig-like domain (group 2)
VATLEVAPPSATVAVGGTAQYSVVARDATGQVMTTPTVTWAAETPAVGTITPDGLATGASLGQTRITATTGSVVSPAAVLIVVETGACDGIAAVPQWTVNLEYVYADSITTLAGAEVSATQRAVVTATLSSQGAVYQNKVNWVGPLVPGLDHLSATPKIPVHIIEDFSDLFSDPTLVGKLFYDQGGLPAPTPGVDGFRLEVDLATCTFRFFAAPSTHTKLQKTEHAIHVAPGPDEGLREFTQITELGLVQKGVTPLGDWRTVGMGDYSKAFENLTSYSVAATVPIDVDALIPSGLFAQAFFDPLNPEPRPNTWDLYFRIAPQF